MEPEQFAAAIRESEARIRAYITRMVGNADEADDLLQETFARAHAGKEAFRGEAKIATWLYSVATNVCLDYLKSAGRRRLVATPPEALAEIARGVATEEGPRFSAALLLDRAGMGECVRRLIAELPEGQRMALLLHDLEEMTGQEVAAALGCTLAALKVRLHRARQRLRALLEENCTFSRDSRGVFVCEPKPPTGKAPA